MNGKLTAKEYHADAMRTADIMNIYEAAIKLPAEVGEMLNALGKRLFQGHQIDKTEVVEELGDICWYIAYFSACVGATFEEVLISNIKKRRERYPDGFNAVRSVNRGEATEEIQQNAAYRACHPETDPDETADMPIYLKLPDTCCEAYIKAFVTDEENIDFGEIYKRCPEDCFEGVDNLCEIMGNDGATRCPRCWNQPAGKLKTSKAVEW